MKLSHDFNELALKPLLRVLEHNAIYQYGRYEFYRNIPKGTAREAYVRSILWADAQNYVTPDGFAKRNAYFWGAPTEGQLASSMPNFSLHRVPALASQPSQLALLPFFSNFEEIQEENWTTAELKSWIHTITTQAAFRSQGELKKQGRWHGHSVDEELTQKLWSKDWNRLIHLYIRWALMATMPGPNGAESMRILGRQETLRRLEVAGEVVKRKVEEDKANEKEEGRKDDDGADAAAMATMFAMEDVVGKG